jgi:glycosyltransferase involved in cell wall biosynthesis
MTDAAPMRVHQWVPAAHRGDAVGDSARVMRARLREQGYQSDIFALEIDDAMRGEVRPFSDPSATAGDVTIFHFATPSPMSDAFRGLRHGRVVQYHNITPPGFFEPFAPELVQLVAAARRELQSLVGCTDLAVGPSEYNRGELRTMGFRETGVLPLAVDTGRLTSAPDRPAIRHWLCDGVANILFVGRVAPNKKIEDIIRLGEAYGRVVDGRFRIVIVGREDCVPAYTAALRALAASLGWPAGRLVFTGPLPDEELAAVYRSSSVYVSMSEHEGFCAPLVEAMAMDLPVLAYASSAVPETLSGAGIQFSLKDFEQVAALLGLVVEDRAVRSGVIDGQRRRLAHFQSGRVDEALGRLVSRFQ